MTVCTEWYTYLLLMPLQLGVLHMDKSLTPGTYLVGGFLTCSEDRYTWTNKKTNEVQHWATVALLIGTTVVRVRFFTLSDAQAAVGSAVKGDTVSIRATPSVYNGQLQWRGRAPAA